MGEAVAVVGTIFVDCKGFAQDQYLAESRNLGRVAFVHGGVGRNVAENLAGLALPVALVSTTDGSGLGHEVVERLAARGVETRWIAAAERGMGMWLAILDESGNLAGSISQMPELQPFADLIEARGDELARQYDHLVLELDLNEPISRAVRTAATRAGKPVYGIPGNLDVVLRHPELLRGLDCFICNHHEAGRLWGRELDAEVEAAARAYAIEAVDGASTGAEVDAVSGLASKQSDRMSAPLDTVANSDATGHLADDSSTSARPCFDATSTPYASLLQELHSYTTRAGLHAMVITLGAYGSLYCDARTGSCGYQPAYPVRMVDSSGAGDAFFSGTVAGLVRGLPLQDAVRLGTRIAAWTIESPENTCPDLQAKLNQPHP